MNLGHPPLGTLISVSHGGAPRATPAGGGGVRKVQWRPSPLARRHSGGNGNTSGGSSCGRSFRGTSCRVSATASSVLATHLTNSTMLRPRSSTSVCLTWAPSRCCPGVWGTTSTRPGPAPPLGPPKLHVTLLPPDPSSAPATQTRGPHHGAGPASSPGPGSRPRASAAADPGEGGGGRWSPGMDEAVARMDAALGRVENRRLNASDHAQDVRHIVLDLSGSGISYSPGDVVHVWPGQAPDAVHAFLARCGLDPDARVVVRGAGEGTAAAPTETQKGAVQANGGSHPAAGVPLFDLVAATLDVTSASPRRFFFEVLSQFASDAREQEKLQFFTSAEGRDELYQYNQRERRTVLEVLEEFSSVSVPLPWLLQACPRLRPRTFSISSSLLAHPAECHVTLAVVSHQTPLKRTRWGLCSRWLAEQDPSAAEPPLVPVWVTQGTLQLPPPQVPLILIGPGTGCAPFRAFIQERAALMAGLHSQAAVDGGKVESRAAVTNYDPETSNPGGAGTPSPPLQGSGDTVAPVLFFFGCRYREKDFLYRDEWQQFRAGDAAPLNPDRGGGFFVAFSRDQEPKVYVQHRIREQGRLVWNLLRQGGAVFIAGSANKMPADVSSALADVMSEEGLLGKAGAEQWVKALQRVGRMYSECWS